LGAPAAQQGAVTGRQNVNNRHCERSEAIQR
jgi:hypothetical protein